MGTGSRFGYAEKIPMIRDKQTTHPNTRVRRYPIKFSTKRERGKGGGATAELAREGKKGG